MIHCRGLASPQGLIDLIDQKEDQEEEERGDWVQKASWRDQGPMYPLGVEVRLEKVEEQLEEEEMYTAANCLRPFQFMSSGGRARL